MVIWRTTARISPGKGGFPWPFKKIPSPLLIVKPPGKKPRESPIITAGHCHKFSAFDEAQAVNLTAVFKWNTVFKEGAMGLSAVTPVLRNLLLLSSYPLIVPKRKTANQITKEILGFEPKNKNAGRTALPLRIKNWFSGGIIWCFKCQKPANQPPKEKESRCRTLQVSAQYRAEGRKAERVVSRWRYGAIIGYGRPRCSKNDIGFDRDPWIRRAWHRLYDTVQRHRCRHRGK